MEDGSWQKMTNYEIRMTIEFSITNFEFSNNFELLIFTTVLLSDIVIF